MTTLAVRERTASRSPVFALPNSVVVKMALGEAPESIPVSADVRRGELAAAQSLDGGAVDRIVRHFTGAMRIARVHPAAASLMRPGARHLNYDDREQVFGLARTFRIEFPPGASIAALVDSLNQITTVESAAPNYVTTTPFVEAAASMADADWEPWELVQAAEALAYEPGDPAVIVGVVDSGVSPSHPELPALRAGYDTVQLGTGELGAGLRLLGDARVVDGAPLDRYVGHGMACAGIIGALGLGMAPGLAGTAQILPMRALGAARFPGRDEAVGIGAATDLDMAMKLAVDLGAKVINMSFGTDDTALDPALPKPHAEVVAYALDRGCVLVAASGNNGQETKYWPAAYPDVIAVGSVGRRARASAFSTRGDHVACCAPGEQIRTLGLSGYQSVTGTSFAAPFAAATAALMVARAQRRSVPIGGQQVRDLLMRSATPFSGAAEGCGAGVLNAAGALHALDAWIDRTLPGTRGEDEDE